VKEPLLFLHLRARSLRFWSHLGLLQRFCSQVFPSPEIHSRGISVQSFPFYERLCSSMYIGMVVRLSCISCSTRAIFLTVTSEICIRILVFDLKVFMSLAML